MRLIRAIVVIVMLTGATGGTSQAQASVKNGQAGDTTIAEVRTVLDRYVKAVNDADEEGLHKLWVQPDSPSYVNPMQRLRSWDELQGFWRGFLKSMFTRRTLTPSNVAVDAAGDVAWAVFDWEFSATQADGKPYQSRGWETHVYRRTDQGWRISHVHYSVPPMPPAGGQAKQ
jgi:ketosteroid isomerase-like protein